MCVWVILPIYCCQWQISTQTFKDRGFSIGSGVGALELSFADCTQSSLMHSEWVVG